MKEKEQYPTEETGATETGAAEEVDIDALEAVSGGVNPFEENPRVPLQELDPEIRKKA